MTHETCFLLAVDGGGTKCRVRLSDGDGLVLGEAVGGSANIASDRVQALQTIMDTIAQACQSAGLERVPYHSIYAAMGLAGANAVTDLDAVASGFGFEACRIVTDVEIAHRGVFYGGDGLLAVLGTGSAFLHVKEGVSRLRGGWGLQVSDLSSGAWIGRAALLEALLAHDGINPSSALTDAVLARFAHDPTEIVSFASEATPADYAAFAPLVLDSAARDDTCARRIMDQALRDLERALTALAMPSDMPLALYGGLADWYAAHLSTGLKTRLINPLGTALDGALNLARDLVNSPRA